MGDPIVVRIESVPRGIEGDPVFRILAKRWRLVAACAFLAGVVGLVLSFLITPVYRASVLAAPSEASGFQSVGGIAGGLGGLASIAGIAVPGGFNVESARALLESRIVLRRVIEKHELLTMLFSERWDETSRSWTVSESSEVPTLDDGVDRFLARNISVEFDAVTGQTIVSVDWPDAATAAAVANDIVAQVNRNLRDKAIADAGTVMELLGAEIERTDVVEVRQALFKLVEEQVKYSTIAKAREDFAFTVLDPAVPPSAKDVHWPKPILMTLFGMFAGVLLGGGFAFAGEIWRASKRRQAQL